MWVLLYRFNCQLLLNCLNIKSSPMQKPLFLHVWQIVFFVFNPKYFFPGRNIHLIVPYFCKRIFKDISKRILFTVNWQHGSTLPSQLIIVSVHGSIQPIRFFRFVEITVYAGLSGIHALSLSNAFCVVSKISCPYRRSF